MEKTVFWINNNQRLTETVNSLIEWAKEKEISVSDFYCATEIANKMLEKAAREAQVNWLEVEAANCGEG